MPNQNLCKFIVGLGAFAMTLVLATSTHAQMSEELAAQLSQNADQHVIVIMKSQPAAVHKDSPERAWRSAAIDVEQSPLMDELRQVRATNVKNFHVVNAFAATVSKGELERLKVHPAVAAVVPDIVIHRRPRNQRETAPKSARSVKANTSSSTGSSSGSSSSLTLNVIPGACAPNGGVQLAPEGLALTHTDSDDPFEPTARSLGFTGAGVKVAWLAQGIDPNNVNFIRPDGKSVFDPSIGGDYQDFSGDGPGAPTTGGESFLDANTLSGQGIHVYNVQNIFFQPDPTACNVRIEGVAPGAALVGLRVFGTFEISTLSNVLEAIDYAVETDHVDVINESIGDPLIPDAVDVFKLFDEAAVAAGVVVTVSSGDSGESNTIESPASDPLLISVGASTQFQVYAQSNLFAARYFATTGWLSNNISSFSSGGFDEAGRTMDLVAPGDLGWISCDASPNFIDCINPFTGQFYDVISSGGTSESSPFVAGAAALVIQAYRQTHGGASPTPALVKQILLSTAADLSAPASEQGAGLLDSYRAVRLAESIPTSDGLPQPLGSTLLFSTNQLNAIGAPGASQSWSVTVTNTGAYPQLVNLSGRTLGLAQNVQRGSVTLNDSTSPKFVDWFGFENNWATFTFTVPPGVARLDGSLAYPGTPSAAACGCPVSMILVDPLGRFAANSQPQGVSNFGRLDVVRPLPGIWTGAIFDVVGSIGGVNGTIPWQVETEQFISFGSITPNNLVLGPGQSQSFNVSATTPLSPGDLAGSIVATSNFGLGETTSIPITLRSLIDVSHGGSFTGVLTGGNGRPPQVGQLQYYEFDVPPGIENITANVSLANDPNNNVGSYLVSPDGDTLGFGQNSFNGTNGLSLTASTLNPVAGRWTLIVDFMGPVVGNEVADPYTGNIVFNKGSASAIGLPNNVAHKLAAGTPVTIPVTITNNGAAPENFFIDARLDQTTGLVLAPQFGSSDTVTLPMPGTIVEPDWLVPTQTSSLSLSQTSTVPAMFDFSSPTGDPGLASASLGSASLCADTASASYSPSGGTVTAGPFWVAEPTECGPYAAAPPTGSATISMTANAKAFDPAVSSPTGDFWLASTDPAAFATFSPLVLNPGQTATINVTITPSGAPGTVIKGALYIDDFLSNVPPYGLFTGDELAVIPYAYTIK